MSGPALASMYGQQGRLLAVHSGFGTAVGTADFLPIARYLVMFRYHPSIDTYSFEYTQILLPILLK